MRDQVWLVSTLIMFIGGSIVLSVEVVKWVMTLFN